MTLLNSITIAGAYTTALETAYRSDTQARPATPKARRARFSLPLLAFWMKRTA